MIAHECAHIWYEDSGHRFLLSPILISCYSILKQSESLAKEILKNAEYLEGLTTYSTGDDIEIKKLISLDQLRGLQTALILNRKQNQKEILETRNKIIENGKTQPILLIVGAVFSLMGKPEPLTLSSIICT